MRLDSMIAEIGGLAETQLAAAIEALVKRDTEAATRVVEADRRIDAIQAEIDAFAIGLLSGRRPAADDVRIVVAALRVASNLERIGDYAKNIAKRTVPLAQVEPIGSTAQTISRMGRIVQDMIKNVLDAFLTRDVGRAGDVRTRDREVDQLHTSLFGELLNHMIDDPRRITACAHLLFVAKNVERIGDHATSVAEQVCFMVRGAAPSDERPKQDNSSFTVVALPTDDSYPNSLT